MLARAAQALRAPREAELDDAAREALWRAPLVTSVTRLEQFAQCPFQHFTAHGLRLRPRAEHAVSALHLGRLYHAVLEQFVNDLNDRQERLRDLSADEIAARLKTLTESGVKTFADAVRLDEAEAADARRRGGYDLPAAMQGQRRFLAPTPLDPAMTEQVFGGGGADDLPALTLRLGDGRLVQVRGKIDRVDFVTAGDRALAVVFDYKRKIGERLRLTEAYHGLALQLLTYLLVLRDGVKRHGAATIVPGGAFYLPLIGRYKPVEHPSDADDAEFNPFALFQPRGVLDYDWLDALDPTLQGKSGHSAAFAAARRKAEKDAAEDSGEISDLERSDAVPRGVLPALLDHVRHALTDLAERWAAGEIAVWPARLDDRVPCPTCRFGGVCRVEPTTRRTRSLESLSRKEVIARLQGGAAGIGAITTGVAKADSKSEEQPESSKTRAAKPKASRRKGADHG